MQPKPSQPASPPLATLRGEISARAFMDEAAAVAALLPDLAFFEALDAPIQDAARALVASLRENGAGSGVEAFLHEYGLETREGVAVMCLAEALLRIPDGETADRLIRDKFEGTDWEEHLGKSDSLFVNASSWGLLLTGGVVNFSTQKGERPSGVFRRLAGRIGAPAVREALKKAMHIIGGQFVLGEDIEDALRRAQPMRDRGFRHSFDILGEGARTASQAEHYFAAYKQAIRAIGKTVESGDMFAAPSLSVKLSALHPRYSLAQEARVTAELLPRVKELALLARDNGMAIAIDAEEATRLDIELLLFEALHAAPELANYEGAGFVLQAYQKRAFYVIDWLRALAERTGKRMPVRLVKGAYWDSEIKFAQQHGLAGYPVFTRKEHTDASYLACARRLLSQTRHFFPQFATHNALTLSAVRALAEAQRIPAEAYEFQRLHGMGEKLYDAVAGDANCRIYAPVGRHKDLLAYLIRRLLENGANTSFVNLLMDRDTSIRKVLEDPVALTKKNMGSPAEHIPRPKAIYGARENSPGADFGNAREMEEMQSRLARFAAASWQAAPTISDSPPPPPGGEKGREILNPARNDERVGHVREAAPEDMARALAEARQAFDSWSAAPAERRAGLLEKAADLLEKNYHEAMALLVREAGKTLPDAVAEVRETMDFCRYYAAQARLLMGRPEKLPGPTGEDNRLSLHGRGVWLAISPWNFPLAIFTGQVAAALAAGNCVLAKPAGQTPLVAAFMMRLLHEAGIPREVAQLVPGGGREVGEALVKNEDIAGVVFTGSTATAKRINRMLAEREGPIVPLIAETGGQNCMVVDSSALLEQAADDILLSAFGSAGQRCSALRVLFAQEEIADELLDMIRGAMAELRLGDPADPATDVGPVIDKYAQGELLKHIGRMKKEAKLIAAAQLPEEWERAGTFVPPHAFEIAHIGQLTEEQFGPVLHVARYKAGKLREVADAINGTGFGLTCGIHSRIEDHWELLRPLIKAGNAYINRGMTGAVVGVQPFGGEGLSGTGPKAGGPHYLLRFVTERATSVNTAAIGGNLDLLSGR